MSQFQGSVNSSAMFLTAAAQNLLCMKLAAELGVIIASPWLTWFKVRSGTYVAHQAVIVDLMDRPSDPSPDGAPDRVADHDMAPDTKMLAPRLPCC